MSTNTNPSKSTALALNQKSIEGIGKYLAHVKTLTLAGTSYAPKELQAVFQAEIDANKAVDTAEAQYTQQVVAAKLARTKVRVTRKALKGYVLSVYGADAVQMLKDFGIAVPKPLGPKTAESKAQAAGKATATKKAKKAAIDSLESPAPIAPAPVVAASPKP
jgi:hypothetical protein